MWSLVGKYLLQAALWALQNPQVVDNGIKEIHDLVDAINAAKQPSPPQAPKA
jgi:hypothetical protein